MVFCCLQLSFDDIQLKAGTQVIVPSSYRANYCQGNCRYPIPSFLNASLHAEIQSYLHFKNPDEIPNPCCIATELISLVVLERLSNWTIQTAVYDNIAATKCGCVWYNPSKLYTRDVQSIPLWSLCSKLFPFSIENGCLVSHFPLSHRSTSPIPCFCLQFKKIIL